MYSNFNTARQGFTCMLSFVGYELYQTSHMLVSDVDSLLGPCWSLVGPL